MAMQASMPSALSLHLLWKIEVGLVVLILVVLRWKTVKVVVVNQVEGK